MLASLLLNEPVPGRRVIYGVYEEDCTEEICQEFAPLAEVRPRKAPRIPLKFDKPEYIAAFFDKMTPRKKRADDAALALVLSLGV